MLFEGDINELRGKLIDVKINEVRSYMLLGERAEGAEPR